MTVPVFVGSWTSAQFNNTTGGSLAGRTSTAGNFVGIQATATVNTATITHSQAGSVQTGRAFENVGGASTDFSTIRYIENIAGGASHTVTITTSAGQFSVLNASEYSGVATSSSIDQANTGSGTGSGALTTASVTTTQADELILCGGTEVESTNSAWTAGASFNLRGNIARADLGDTGFLEDRIVSSTGSYSGAATWTGVSNPRDWRCQIVTFKAAGAATAPGQVTGLTAQGKPGRAALSWSAPSDGGSAITDYLIERAPDVAGSPGTYATVTDGTSTATTYTDTGLTNGSIYWYRVSAINAIGTGTASTAASASPTAHPWIETTTEEHGTSLGSANAIANPAGAATGDLIIAVVSVDLSGSATGSPVTASAGWTALTNTSQTQGTTVVHMRAFGRVLDGSGSDALAVTGPSQDYVVAMHRIPSGDHSVTNASINTDITAAGTTGSSTNGDPPNDNPAVSKDWLWLAGIAVDGTTTTTVTGVPTNYTQQLNVVSAAASTSCVVGATASRRLTGSSEDPGTFTHASRAWCTVTIAIPPASGGKTGTAAATLAATASAAAGTPTRVGTVARTTAATASAASGTPVRVGTVARTLANATSAAAGASTHKGTVARTLANVTSAGAGRSTHVGTTSATLAATTATAAGTVGQEHIGTVAVTLAATSSLAAGAPTRIGTVARTLANSSLAASGTVGQTHDGTVAVTLANTTGAAAGTPTRTGTLARSLANVTSSASGSSGSAKIGTVAVTLASVSSSAAGTPTRIGTTARTLAGTTSAAAGQSTHRGTVAQALASTSCSAAGSPVIAGTVAIALAPALAAAQGGSTHVGLLAATLDDVVTDAHGGPASAGPFPATSTGRHRLPTSEGGHLVSAGSGGHTTPTTTGGHIP